MLNELLFLEIITVSILLNYIKVLNILTLWYVAGLYLITLGLYFLNIKADIFIGFLWVVDFGVGLIFFIFILHFTNFLYQKTISNPFYSINSGVVFFSIMIIFFLYFYGSPQNSSTNFFLKKNWFFFVCYYSFYTYFYNFSTSQLQLLRDMYFYICSFEFVVINFMLFYGLIATVLLCFMLKKFFNNKIIYQFRNFSLTSLLLTTYFIRQQNFLRQQNISTGTRVWIKRPHQFN